MKKIYDKINVKYVERTVVFIVYILLFQFDLIVYSRLLILLVIVFVIWLYIRVYRYVRISAYDNLEKLQNKYKEKEELFFSYLMFLLKILLKIYVYRNMF